ncbi:hypothetical protein [Microbulbifer sp. SSSA005]|uniref:hypothetical protein n=1 Tax=Microbulbifer sp. SSSA005 TaxID=3243378 RepID=UPI0040399D75
MFSLLPINTYAGEGYLTKGVTVTKASSTSQNEDAFWVWYSSNTDNCSGKIRFQHS